MYICSKQSLGPMARRPHRGLCSFSLVEVVIAIGVASFVLISILGMMSFAGQTVQQSDKYSRLANVANQALATVSAQQFESCPYAAFFTNGNLGALPTWTNYYNTEGLPTNSANAYFETVVSDATSTTVKSNLSSPDTGTRQQIIEPLLIQIYYPIPSSLSIPFANTNSVITAAVNYGSL